MKKLVVVTGSRAEYGVLSSFLRLAKQSEVFDLHLVVAGMHLSDLYGKTIQEVESDGFRISGRVEMILPENSPTSAAKELSRGVAGFTETFASLAPSMVLVEGDRIEALAASLAARYMNIPLVHSGGGDLTTTVDDAARHAISIFAQTHFVSTDKARQVLLGLRKNEEDIFVVGGLGIDTIMSMEYEPRAKVLDDIGLPAGARYILVTFHPVPEYYDLCSYWADNVFQAAVATGHFVVITFPNSDPGSLGIIASIHRFASSYLKVRFFASLGQRRYLNALKQCEVLLGNSSSGLYEAPSFMVPVVDVGLRQDGRIRAANVISCSYDFSDIQAALHRTLMDEEFRATLPSTVNPYGDGHTAERMLYVIQERI